MGRIQQYSRLGFDVTDIIHRYLETERREIGDPETLSPYPIRRLIEIAQWLPEQWQVCQQRIDALEPQWRVVVAIG